MNFKTTILLVALLLIVGASAYFLLQGAGSAELAPSEVMNLSGSGRLFVEADFPREKLKSVTIEHTDGKTIVIERDGDDWAQTKPVEFPLNSWSATPLMDDTFEMEYSERLRPGSDDAPSLEEANLQKPLAKVTFSFAGETELTQTVHLGKQTVAGKAYLKKGTDPRIYVVPNTLHRLVLANNVNEWRKRSLDGPKEANVNQITITQGITSIGAIKTQGSWTLMQPASGRADQQVISEMLKAIDSIYVDKFVADSPEDLAPYSLDYPKLRFTVSFTNSKIKTFCIGSAVDLSKDAKLYATWDSGTDAGSVIFTISKSEAEKFEKTVNDLRDAQITPIDAIAVTDVNIKQPGGNVLNLTKGPDGWEFAAPKPGFTADHENVTKFVEAITTAKAKDYRPNVEVKIPHEVEVKIAATGRSDPDLLKIFASDKASKRRMVLRNNETTGYMVPGSEIDGAFKPALALRNRLVEDIDRSKINQIIIKRDDGRTLEFTRQVDASDANKDPGQWQLKGADKFETGALQSLLFDLAPIKAEAWIISNDRPVAQLYNVTIGTATGESHELTIDTKDNIATMKDLKPSFQVAETLVKKITTEYEYRTVLDFKTEQIKQITVRRDGKVVTITKQDDKYVGSDGQKVDQSAAGGLFDTLAGLRIEQYKKVSPISSRQTLLQIELLTTDSKKHTLTFSNMKDMQSIAILDSRGIELDEETAEKLKKQMLD